MSKTSVFANGLEIACKASDGKSPAAFPDPCWSPPSPKAGWIVIPYANTAYAKDTTNASKTVFIGNKPVMLKDKSYFKKSTGNEPAASSKGLATGVKKGKAYFTSWSMDIKIEGYNVCRHTDLMTHNHGSVPGNTGAWHFLSEDDKGKCKDAIKDIKKECGISKSEQKKFIKSQKKRNSKRGSQKKTAHTIRPQTWKDKHCKSLLFKPRADLLKQRLTELETDAKDMYEDLAGEAWSAVGDRALEKGGNYLARTGGKHVAGLAGWAGGPIVEAGVQLGIFVTDIVDAIYSIVALPFQLYGAYSNIADVSNLLDRIPKTLEEIRAIEGDEIKRKKLNKKLVEEARKAANDNDCIRARKCMLVPYELDKANIETRSVKMGGQTYKEQTGGGNFFTMMGMGTSEGCCPGQTGHHLIPDSWAEKANCTDYKKGDAPVVCVEGISQNDGTHKTIHYNLNQELIGAQKKQPNKETFTQAEIINMAAKSHAKTFPKSGDCTICIGAHPCDKECIKAQLQDYYDCGGFTPEEINQKKEEPKDTQRE